MGRRQGSVNRDHQETKHQLALKVAFNLMRENGEPATLRDMAISAGVTQPTLKHYFKDREGTILAALEAASLEGSQYLEEMQAVGQKSAAEAVSDLVNGVADAWTRFDLGSIYAAGLGLGIGHETVGPGYVNHLLEPLLQATEAILAKFVKSGELDIANCRYAALILISPVFMALIHQDSLGGVQCRPLNLNEFVQTHLEDWLSRYAG